MARGVAGKGDAKDGRVGSKAPAKLNMCVLLSLSLNNTRYLPRDKCLNRRIAGRRSRGVSPHRSPPSLLSLHPPLLPVENTTASPSSSISRRGDTSRRIVEELLHRWFDRVAGKNASNFQRLAIGESLLEKFPRVSTPSQSKQYRYLNIHTSPKCLLIAVSIPLLSGPSGLTLQSVQVTHDAHNPRGYSFHSRGPQGLIWT